MYEGPSGVGTYEQTHTGGVCSSAGALLASLRTRETGLRGPCISAPAGGWSLCDSPASTVGAGLGVYTRFQWQGGGLPGGLPLKSGPHVQLLQGR